MEAINGFTLLLSSSVVFNTSRHIWSEARAEPPPLSILSTIAFISLFSRADLIAFIMVSSPIIDEPAGPGLLLPDTIPPTA